MFNYTEEHWQKIKDLAEFQFRYGLDLVSIEHEELGVTIINPWIDSSARFPLDDDGAVKEYGEEFIKKWCEAAKEFFNKNSWFGF